MDFDLVRNTNFELYAVQHMCLCDCCWCTTFGWYHMSKQIVHTAVSASVHGQGMAREWQMHPTLATWRPHILCHVKVQWAVLEEGVLW